MVLFQRSRSLFYCTYICRSPSQSFARLIITPFCPVNTTMTTLHEACRIGDLDLVQEFLSRPDVDVNARDGEEGWTPLLSATEHLPVVQLICQHGADVTASDSYDRTVLHIATYRDHTPVIAWLIETYQNSSKTLAFRGFLTERVDQARETALHYAAYRGNLELAQYLVEVGQIDVMARNRRGKTALALARQADELPLVFYLQSLQNLMDASLHCDHTEIMRLCQAGVFAEFQIGRFGEQLIHMVCQLGDLEGARILHQHGRADLNVPSRSVLTPLHYAARNGHDQVVRWLCEQQGVTVDCTCPLGSTPLVVAVSNGYVDTAKVLLDFGADANHKVSSSGLSPIYLACQEGCIPMVRLLLEKGARMERNLHGWLPLHAACHSGHVNTLQVLLSHIDKLLDPSDLIRALQLAGDGGHFEILKFFLVPRIIAMV